MNASSLFIPLAVLALVACSPPPSPQAEAEIRALRENIASFEERNADLMRELDGKEETLAKNLESLQTKKRRLLEDIARLEKEAAEVGAAPTPTPSTQKMLDRITLFQGPERVVEVKEIRNGQVTILADGEEYTGELRALESIAFRSVPASP